MEKLQSNIEDARKKLDDAVGNGYNEQICLQLSVELDELIELYISMKERTNNSVPMA